MASVHYWKTKNYRVCFNGANVSQVVQHVITKCATVYIYELTFLLMEVHLKSLHGILDSVGPVISQVSPVILCHVIDIISAYTSLR